MPSIHHLRQGASLGIQAACRLAVSRTIAMVNSVHVRQCVSEVDRRPMPRHLRLSSAGLRLSGKIFLSPPTIHWSADFDGVTPSVVKWIGLYTSRALPVYTIADVDDICGRVVAYERLLPFSEIVALRWRCRHACDRFDARRCAIPNFCAARWAIVRLTISSCRARS